MEQGQPVRFAHPLYSLIEATPFTTYTNIAQSLPREASKDILLAMWQEQDLMKRRVALYGFISQMPTEPVSQQVVFQALQEDTLCHDALHWIRSQHAIALVPLVAEALLKRGVMRPEAHSVALELLSELGFDFRSYEQLLLNWASRHPTFDDVTPIVATAILLKLRHPKSKRLLSRLLRLSDQNLLAVGLRILGDHTPVSMIKDKLLHLLLHLPMREDCLEILFMALELILSVPLSKRTLQQVCHLLEIWNAKHSSDRFKKLLHYFYNAYLTKQGYQIGEQGWKLVALHSPDLTNIPLVSECVRRLLESHEVS